MKALSITDHGVLYGLTSFFKQAEKHNIKPLLGCEIYLVFEDDLATTNEERAVLSLASGSKACTICISKSMSCPFTECSDGAWK